MTGRTAGAAMTSQSNLSSCFSSACTVSHMSMHPHWVHVSLQGDGPTPSPWQQLVYEAFTGVCYSKGTLTSNYYAARFKQRRNIYSTKNTTVPEKDWVIQSLWEFVNWVLFQLNNITIKHISDTLKNSCNSIFLVRILGNVGKAFISMCLLTCANPIISPDSVQTGSARVGP